MRISVRRPTSVYSAAMVRFVTALPEISDAPVNMLAG
jgi:hypothetical protein